MNVQFRQHYSRVFAIFVEKPRDGLTVKMLQHIMRVTKS